MVMRQALYVSFVVSFLQMVSDLSEVSCFYCCGMHTVASVLLGIVALELGTVGLDLRGEKLFGCNPQGRARSSAFAGQEPPAGCGNSLSAIKQSFSHRIGTS